MGRDFRATFFLIRAHDAWNRFCDKTPIHANWPQPRDVRQAFDAGYEAAVADMTALAGEPNDEQRAASQ